MIVCILLQCLNKWIQKERYVAVCDQQGTILWQSQRNGVQNILSTDETKELLKRAVDNWNVRKGLSPKLGKGKYAIVSYDKLKRITIPLENGHLLFASIEGEKSENVLDMMNIVEWVQKHPTG